MATSSSPLSALSRAQVVCATCVRGGKSFVGRYRDFLLRGGKSHVEAAVAQRSSSEKRKALRL